MITVDISDDFLREHMPEAERAYLNNIPVEESLSYQFSIGFLHRMDNLIKQEKCTPAVRIFFTAAKRVAIILITFMIISFTTVMTVEAYRLRFFEIVTTVWTEFTHVIVRTEGVNDDNTLTSQLPSYLPRGFSIDEKTKSNQSLQITYKNGSGAIIRYRQMLINTNGILLDTEDTSIDEQQIMEQTIFSYTNKGFHQLYWYDDRCMYTIMSDIGKEELFKMAESIIKNKN